MPSGARHRRLPTALIGRVPIDGTVSDPIRSKVLIGELSGQRHLRPSRRGRRPWSAARPRATGRCRRACAVEDPLGHAFSCPGQPSAQCRRDNNKGSSSGSNAGHNGAGIRGGLGWISAAALRHSCVGGERAATPMIAWATRRFITAAGAAASLIKSDNGSVWPWSPTTTARWAPSASAAANDGPPHPRGRRADMAD